MPLDIRDWVFYGTLTERNTLWDMLLEVINYEGLSEGNSSVNKTNVSYTLVRCVCVCVCEFVAYIERYYNIFFLISFLIFKVFVAIKVKYISWIKKKDTICFLVAVTMSLGENLGCSCWTRTLWGKHHGLRNCLRLPFTVKWSGIQFCLTWKAEELECRGESGGVVYSSEPIPKSLNNTLFYTEKSLMKQDNV